MSSTKRRIRLEFLCHGLVRWGQTGRPIRDIKWKTASPQTHTPPYTQLQERCRTNTPHENHRWYTALVGIRMPRAGKRRSCICKASQGVLLEPKEVLLERFLGLRHVLDPRRALSPARAQLQHSCLAERARAHSRAENFGAPPAERCQLSKISSLRSS